MGISFMLCLTIFLCRVAVCCISYLSDTERLTLVCTDMFFFQVSIWLNYSQCVKSHIIRIFLENKTKTCRNALTTIVTKFKTKTKQSNTKTSFDDDNNNRWTVTVSNAGGRTVGTSFSRTRGQFFSKTGWVTRRSTTNSTWQCLSQAGSEDSHLPICSVLCFRHLSHRLVHRCRKGSHHEKYLRSFSRSLSPSLPLGLSGQRDIVVACVC